MDILRLFKQRRTGTYMIGQNYDYELCTSHRVDGVLSRDTRHVAFLTHKDHMACLRLQIQITSSRQSKYIQ